MHEFRPLALPAAFTACWKAARVHLNRQVQGGIQTWINATLGSPSPEQFSFRLGNQLFFVRLTLQDWRGRVPGTLEGVLRLAQQCNGHACLLPMAYTSSGWKPGTPGWGLINAKTDLPLNPIDLVSDELIVMTDWELHDFAVQVVRDQLRQKGHEVTSWQGSPDIDPSIWMNGTNGPEPVIVRVARHPLEHAPRPSNLREIARNRELRGMTSHFASVSVANCDQTYDTTGRAPVVPLYRGHGMHVRYSGLSPITDRHCH